VKWQLKADLEDSKGGVGPEHVVHDHHLRASML
jgi:hypothetical protein